MLHVVRMGEVKNASTPRGRCMYRCEDNIKMNLREIGLVYFGFDFSVSRQRSIMDYFEHRKQPSDYLSVLF